MKRAGKVIVGLLAVALAAMGGYAIANGDDLVKSGRTPAPVVTKGKGEKCVEPTDVMRASHYEFILHQRDKTMHQGIRSSKHSLKECIECHAGKDEQGQSLPINADGQFCHSCHEYAAVTIDCFECHATTPEGGKANLHGMEQHGAARTGLAESMAMSDRFLQGGAR